MPVVFAKNKRNTLQNWLSIIFRAQRVMAALASRREAYLRAVYPTSSADASQLLRQIQWFYSTAPAEDGREERIIMEEADHAVTAATHSCKDGLMQSIRRLDAGRRFPLFATQCHPSKAPHDCIRHLFARHDHHHHDHSSPRFIECTHLAFNSKAALGGSSTHTNLSWSDFLDHGRSGWWFTVAPGSGIFYDAGSRICEGTFKNALMIDLLQSLLDRGLQPPCASARGLGLCPNASHFLRAIQQTRFAPCSWPLRCRNDFVLDDSYDPLLMELGRLAGCDSLRLRASPLDLRGAFVDELVDLRLPAGRGFHARHSGPWSEDVAVKWVAEYERERRLTLRDPLSPEDDVRTRPCELPRIPTLRLACTNHVSWTARDEPDRQNYCVRRRPRGTPAFINPGRRRR